MRRPSRSRRRSRARPRPSRFVRAGHLAEGPERLGVSVGGGRASPEFSPRIPLTSVRASFSPLRRRSRRTHHSARSRRLYGSEARRDRKLTPISSAARLPERRKSCVIGSVSRPPVALDARPSREAVMSTYSLSHLSDHALLQNLDIEQFLARRFPGTEW